MSLASAIQAAVEVQGVSWHGRARIASPSALAAELSTALSYVPDLAGDKDFLAALIGECAQETDWFCSAVEYGGPSTRYAPWYGRGFIQLTWESNYSGCAGWFKKIGYNVDVHANPDAATGAVTRWLTGIYYFVSHIAESYWRSHNWNAISGLINAGTPNYYVSAYELRAKSCNAAFNELRDYEVDDMPSADEIATAVWNKQFKLQGNSSGKTVPAWVVLYWLDDQFNHIADRVWGHKVKRAGLPEGDNRANKEVTVGTIMSYMDAFVCDLKNAVAEAVRGITNDETVVKAVQEAIEKCVHYAQTEPGTIEATPLDASVYVVQKGDTLKAIAQNVGKTVEELIKLNNNFDSNALYVGQKVKVAE